MKWIRGSRRKANAAIRKAPCLAGRDEELRVGDLCRPRHHVVHEVAAQARVGIELGVDAALDATGQGPPDQLVESVRHLEVLLSLRERGLDHVLGDLLALERLGDPLVRGGNLRGGDHVRGCDSAR